MAVAALILTAGIILYSQIAVAQGNLPSEVTKYITSNEIRTKLDLIRHEHEEIMSVLQMLSGPKKPTDSGTLSQEISDTLKYLKEKLDIPSSKQMLEGSGSTYVRWGRTVCPNVNGTQKVYDGFAAGDHYTHGGVPSELLCLPKEPTWGKYNDNYLGHSFVYGTEYEVSAMSQENFGKQLHDQNVPCVVCQSVGRMAALRIPGRIDCFSGWTKEYDGFLMGEHYSHAKSSDYTYVDSDPEVVQDKSRDENGHLLHFVEAHCSSGSLPCPPYVHGRAIGCVILYKIKLILRVMRCRSKSILTQFSFLGIRDSNFPSPLTKFLRKPYMQRL